MLDPVVDTWSLTGRLVGVERSLHAAVADRVRNALEPGPGEKRDHLGVSLGFGPEGMAPLTFHVGVEEPRRPGLDHAVDKKLRRAAAPEPPAIVAERKLVAHLRHRRVGLLPERNDDTTCEFAILLEPPIDSEVFGSAVHGVDCREPHLAETTKRVLEPPVARVHVRRGNQVLDESHCGPLLQLAGRRAINTDHGRFFFERDWSIDASELERGAIGQRGVAIEELQEHRLAADHLLEVVTTY